MGNGYWISHRIRLNEALDADLSAWNEMCSNWDIRQTSMDIVQGESPYWAILAFVATPGSAKLDSERADPGDGTSRLVTTAEEAAEFERLRVARASSAREHVAQPI